MHGQHVAPRNQEVHHAEDRFFHFAGVLCAADEHDAAGEIGEDEGVGAGSVAIGHGLEFGRSDDSKLRFMRRQAGRLGPDKKLAHKQGVPGVFGDDADGQLVRGIGSAVEVLDEQIAFPHVRQHALQQRIKFLR